MKRSLFNRPQILLTDVLHTSLGNMSAREWHEEETTNVEDSTLTF